MAVEVENNRYLFRSEAPWIARNNSSDSGDSDTTSEDGTESSEGNRSPSPTFSEIELKRLLAKFFQHNSIHDYESVWWISQNFIWWRHPATDLGRGDLREERSRRSKQLGVAQEIFSSRTAAFSTGEAFDHAECLHESMRPVLRTLRAMWEDIQQLYWKVERDVDFVAVSERDAKKLCKKFKHQLHSAERRLRNSQIIFVPWDTMIKDKK